MNLREKENQDEQAMLGKNSTLVVNILSSSDINKTNKDKRQGIKIRRKHLVFMLENDKKYRQSDILYN